MPRLPGLARAKTIRELPLGPALRLINGRGVPNLDEALLALELAPLHQALVSLLDADAVESFALVVSSEEALPACGQKAETSTPAVQVMPTAGGVKRTLRRAKAWLSTREKPANHTSMEMMHGFHDFQPNCRLRPGYLGWRPSSPEPWSSEAKAVLPSSSPKLHAKAIWGPALAYCVLEAMARKIGGKDTAATALDLFDRLRLREPLARAFSLGGEITEDGWRAAARVRLALLGLTLAGAKPVKGAVDDAFAGFPRGIWDDPDARWLLRVNESGGEWYFNKELHEQMMWWAQLPHLVELGRPAKTQAPAKGGKSAPKSTVKSIAAIGQAVEEACEQAEESGYRVGKKKEAAAKPAKREKGALAK